MKILITGSNGFVGKNLIERLNKEFKNIQVYKFDVDNDYSDLKKFCKDCDFVFNFAAVHRPTNESDFSKVNFNQFKELLDYLEYYNNDCPVLYTSSIQSNNGTLYGESKFLAELALKDHSNKMNSRGIIYRLTNIFGKYARPNAHSVVATFCDNVQKGIPLFVSDPERVMCFNYIDNVIDSFIDRIKEGKKPILSDDKIYEIDKQYNIIIKLSELSSLIQSFAKPNYTPRNHIEKLFYITYKSYGN